MYKFMSEAQKQNGFQEEQPLSWMERNNNKKSNCAHVTSDFKYGNSSQMRNDCETK